MSDIRYGACIEVSTDKEVDCDDSPSDVRIVIDGTADKDSRYEKETRIDGRDDSQPSSSHFGNPKGQSTHSNQETVGTSITANRSIQVFAGTKINLEHLDNKMELEDLVPKDNQVAIRSAASIIAQSKGQRIWWRGGFRRRKDPIWRATETQANNGDWEGVLEQTHQCLINPSVGDSNLNIATFSVESYLLTQAKAQEKERWREHFDAVNTVLDGYKRLYEERIDKKLADDYQTLAKNFKYTASRVNMAQVRYDKFMRGKKFMISKSDQKLLDDFVKLNNKASLKESTKKLNKISSKFGTFGNVLDLVDLVTSFNQAQKSKDWRQFGAKISALGAGMLIGTIASLGIFASSLPVAFIVAALSVVASFYLDEDFWLGIQTKVSTYFLK